VLSRPTEPKAVWCADYKGEFMLADRGYCYPLTITDFASRYLISCDALSTTREVYAFAVFERAFKDFGLPDAIRTDNGVPFASAQALYGLSKLAVVAPPRHSHRTIKPGHPEQNGRHERMHLMLKQDATKPAAANVLQQQARFDAFTDRYNQERPHRHESPRGRVYPVGPPVPRARGARLSLHDWTATITRCGRICWNRRKINVSVVFAGQNVGVRQVNDRIWLVSFMDYDLGYFDDETCRLEPIENPFAAKVLPMAPE
jgi:putative transposase